MYEEFFGLVERPFSIAPDPQYLYMSRSHEEAMAHLSYGLSHGGGFIVLTGEVGTGKTTLCRRLIQELPDKTDVALILNPKLDEIELLQTVCDELGISYDISDSQKILLDQINAHLLDSFAKERQTVLIIDEAQLLDQSVLEQIRLLTNLETTKTKLLKIILIGQPELNDLLSRKDLRQLAQRVTARYHLGALKSIDVGAYINRRLSVAGCKQPIFTKQAIARLARLSQGIPRRINVLADQAMLAAYAQGERWISAKTVAGASNDVFLTSAAKTSKRQPLFNDWRGASWMLVAGALIGANLLAWWWFVPRVSDEGKLLQQSVSVTENQQQSKPASNDRANSNSGVDPDSQNGGTGADADETVNDAVTIVKSSDIKPGTVEVSQVYLTEDADNPSSSADGRDEGLEDLLETSIDQTGRVTAFKNLAALWGYEFSEPILGSLCDSVAANGLNCIDVNSVAQLRAYNRPTIAVLSDNGTLHRVLVRSLDDDQVGLAIGEQTVMVSVEQFERFWNNNAVTFWRSNGFDSSVQRQGDTSDAVRDAKQKIQQVLAEMNLPKLSEPLTTMFDSEMSQRVFMLQSKHSLAADSELGLETKLFINEWLDQGVPTLKSRR